MKRLLVILGILGVLAMGGLYLYVSAASTIVENPEILMEDRVDVYVEPRPVIVLEDPGDEMSFEMTVRIGPALQAGKAATGSGVYPNGHNASQVEFDGRVTVSIVDAATGIESHGIDLGDCVGGCVRTLIWTVIWSDDEDVGRGLPVGEALEINTNLGVWYRTPEPYFPHEFVADSEDLSVEAVLIEDNGS